MIIQALYEHYKTLSTRPGSDVPPPGFAMKPVAWVFNLSADGDLLDVIPLGTARGKRLVPLEMMVPEPPERASTKIAPGFLCDNSMYMTGDDNKGKPDRSRQAFAASRQLHLEILEDVDDDGARAVRGYFLKWDPDRTRDHPALRSVLEDVLSGRNIVFRLDGADGYVHDRPAVREAWVLYRSRLTSDKMGQCLVTGEVAPIARTHPKIKGVTGA